MQCRPSNVIGTDYQDRETIGRERKQTCVKCRPDVAPLVTDASTSAHLTPVSAASPTTPDIFHLLGTVCSMRSRSFTRGFTLLEIVVTLVILTILMGIAIVGFSRLVNWVADNSANTNNNRVALTQQNFAKDWGNYTSYGEDILDVGNDISIMENGAPSTNPNQVSVAVGVNGDLGLATMSTSGACQRLRVTSITSSSDAAFNPVSGGDTVAVTRPESAPCTGQESLPDGVGVVAYTPGGTAKITS